MKEIVMDPVLIMSGTDNTTHPLYVESVNAVEGKNDKKALHYIKNFALSIENGRKRIDMSPITKTSGDITKFSHYKALKQGLEYLSTAGSPLASDLKLILSKVEEFRPYYADGYNRKLHILIMEYEAMVMMLQSSTSLALSTITMKKTPKGIALGVNGEISPNMKKLIHNSAVEITKKGHKSLLEGLMKASNAPRDTNVGNKEEEVKTEAVISAGTLLMAGSAMAVAKEIVNLAKNILVGAFNIGLSGLHMLKTFAKNYLSIISLVRTIAYSYYNRKVNRILKLEEQITFLKKAIEEIQINKSISEEQKGEMIKKREAYIEMWTKKCAKLRAEFSDVEDTSTDQLHADDQKIRQSEKSSDNEFNLDD